MLVRLPNTALTVVKYTYPELQKWLDKYKTNGTFDNVKYQKALRTSIELKYSTTAKSTLQLPGNTKIVEPNLASIAPMNLMVQNFPPSLVEKAKELQATGPQAQSPLAEDGPASGTSATVPDTGNPSESSGSLKAHEAEAGDHVPQTSAVAPHAPAHAHETWTENDYIVNVLFDR